MKNNNNRNNGYSFTPLFHALKHSENYRALSGNAVKLFNHFLLQYNGRNNGDFSASFASMKKEGWKSPTTLNHALKELLHYGFILKTRQGGMHQCSLYALTLFSIDECDGKLEIAETNAPPGNWKITVKTFKRG